MAGGPGPTPPSQRIVFLDVLRGFALFGVVWVGQHHFDFVASSGNMREWFAEWFMTVFGEYKSFGLFAFLFGIGLAVQMDRMESRGVRFAPRWLLRMGVLWLIGFAHRMLLWGNHDILMYYAATGCVLLLFRKLSHRALLACVCVALVFGLSRGTVIRSVNRAFPVSEVDRSARQHLDKQEGQLAKNGSYAENVAYRFEDFRSYYPSRRPALGMVLNGMVPMFLAGLYVVRRGILRDITAHAWLLRRVLWTGLPLGLLLSYFSVPVPKPLPFPQVQLAPPVRELLVQPAFVLLSLSYACGLALLFQRPPWRRWLLLFAPVGRLGLSNYVMQSFIMTSIYCGYGLALYGKVDSVQAVFLAAGVIAAQILISSLILRRFRYGPLEWAWRSLAYPRWRLSSGGPATRKMPSP